MPMYCPNCGTEINLPNAKFCYECGQKLAGIRKIKSSDTSSVEVGDVSRGIHDSAIAGRDVSTETEQAGSGAIAQDGGVAGGKQGVAVGRDVHASTISTGKSLFLHFNQPGEYIVKLSVASVLIAIVIAGAYLGYSSPETLSRIMSIIREQIENISSTPTPTSPPLPVVSGTPLPVFTTTQTPIVVLTIKPSATSTQQLTPTQTPTFSEPLVNELIPAITFTSTSVQSIPTDTSIPTETPMPPVEASIPTQIAPSPTSTLAPVTSTNTSTPFVPTETFTATSTETQTSVPTQEQPIVVGRFSAVNVRSDPNTSAPIIGKIHQGEKYNIIGRDINDAWINVCCINDDPGWVQKNTVNIEGGTVVIPVVQPTLTQIPTPTFTQTQTPVPTFTSMPTPTSMPIQTKTATPNLTATAVAVETSIQVAIERTIEARKPTNTPVPTSTHTTAVVTASPIVQVTIQRVKALGHFDTFGPTPFNCGEADFYAKINIDGDDQETTVIANGNDIQPNWTHTKTVTHTSGSISITIQLWEKDDEEFCTEDEHIDIDGTGGDSNLNLDLSLDLQSCTIAGELGGNCASTLESSGDSDRSATIWFNISLAHP